MKDLLLKWIKAIRIFLDSAEASLGEVPHHKGEGIPPQKTAQEDAPKKEQPVDDNILVPFSRRNSRDTQSTHKDRKIINALLDEWVFVSGIDIKKAKVMLRNHVEVIMIDNMTIVQVSEACAWLREQIDKGKNPS